MHSIGYYEQSIIYVRKDFCLHTSKMSASKFLSFRYVDGVQVSEIDSMAAS
jgi:hypothetical protein